MARNRSRSRIMEKIAGKVSLSLSLFALFLFLSRGLVSVTRWTRGYIAWKFKNCFIMKKYFALFKRRSTLMEQRRGGGGKMCLIQRPFKVYRKMLILKTDWQRVQTLNSITRVWAHVRVYIFTRFWARFVSTIFHLPVARMHVYIHTHIYI